MNEDRTFEELQRDLEDVVARLERGDVPVDDAIALVNQAAYGNQACLFTSSGSAARKFRYEAQVGNIGINVGGAAPMDRSVAAICADAIGITSMGSGKAPSVGTSLDSSAMQTNFCARSATIFSRVSAAPPPLIM